MISKYWWVYGASGVLADRCKKPTYQVSRNDLSATNTVVSLATTTSGKVIMGNKSLRHFRYALNFKLGNSLVGLAAAAVIHHTALMHRLVHQVRCEYLTLNKYSSLLLDYLWVHRVAAQQYLIIMFSMFGCGGNRMLLVATRIAGKSSSYFRASCPGIPFFVLVTCAFNYPTISSRGQLCKIIL